MEKPNRYNKSDRKDFKRDNSSNDRGDFRKSKDDDFRKNDRNESSRDFKRRDNDDFRKGDRNGSSRDFKRRDNDNFRKSDRNESSRDFKRRDNDDFRKGDRNESPRDFKRRDNDDFKNENYKKGNDRYNKSRDDDSFRKKDGFKKDYKRGNREEKKDFFKNAWESDASLERKRKAQEPDEITFSKSLKDEEEQDLNISSRYNPQDRIEEKSKNAPRRFDFRDEEDFRKKKKDYYRSEDFKDKFTSFHQKTKAYDSSNEGRRNVRNKFEGNDKYLERDIQNDTNPEAKMPLNKFLAHCGVSSRRDSVEVIKAGKVMVNGKVELSPGYKVEKTDEVKFNGKVLRPNKSLIYILLNKPKGYITTTDDPKGRRTVMDIFQGEINDRIFPVGRLDRATTGLLLLTNDGELAQKLTHPKYEMRKVYQVKLDKGVTQEHYDSIKEGLMLEDGLAVVDKMTYLDTADEIGLEIHSGKNRIVRRIFESLGYVVEKLDRVMYAGLTKKNLPKGKWRNLTRQEVINLKHLGR